jgi:hypothetical protein
MFQVNYLNYEMTQVKKSNITRFNNCKWDFTPVDLENLKTIFIERDDDLSSVPTLFHYLENVVFNKGILTMREIYQLW